MLRVIAIDDEPSVLEGLRLMVDWDAMGLELCGEAADGVEGLALIETLKPDIVITDIRMPRLDGLQLVKRYAGQHGAPKFIIISGYGEFEYARSALRYGVRSYILKPLDVAEFTEAFSTIAMEIEDERLREAETLELSRYMVSYYIGRIIHSSATPKLYDKLTFLLGLLPGVRFRIVCLMIKDFYQTNQQMDVSGMLMHITEGFGLKQPEAVYYRGLGLFFAVVRDDSSAYGDIVSAYHGLTKNLVPVTVMFSSGEGCGIMDIQTLYRQIEELKLWYLYGVQDDYLIHGQAPEPPGFSEIIELDLPYQRITQTILAGSVEETELLIEQFYQLLHKSRCLAHELRLYQYRLIWLAEDLSSFYSINVKEQLSLFVASVETGNLRGCKQEAEQLLNRLCLQTKNPTVPTHGDLAQSIVDYIRENYKNDLSLQVLADVFSLSPLVVSKIIRKNCGKKFNDLINDIKIENAKLLIATSDIKLSDVASEVGYRDNAYFSNKFRQLTGMLPSEYKCLFV